MTDPQFPAIPPDRKIGDLNPGHVLLLEPFRSALVWFGAKNEADDQVAARWCVAPFGTRSDAPARSDLTLVQWARGVGIHPTATFGVPAVDWWTAREPRIILPSRPISIADARLRAGASAPVAPTATRRPPGLEAQVAAVKQTYGRLRGDIAYRIEHAALFDPAVALTAQFETALVLWDDVDATTPPDEAARRASMVQVTFDTARAHAETVGFAHLPTAARGDAERAAKAARLARATDSEAERRAALARTIAILRSLALYYLPDPEAVDRALTTGPGSL